MKDKLTVKRVLLCLAILGIIASAAWAITMDGDLNPSNEYANSQVGSYSTCYHEFVNGDLYICNDWWKPDTNYDPATYGDYNLFYWSGANDWRLKVRADGTGLLQEKVSGTWTDRYPASNYGIIEVTGYDTTVNDSQNNHPIWEIMIPQELLDDTTPNVVANDPKNGGDSGDPGKNGGWDPSALGFGVAPTINP